MTTQTEALKLALEALEYYDKPLKEYSAKTARDKDFKAIASIKEALAQPEQEPVAWMEGESVYWHTNPSLNDWIRANGTPLYTTPPQRTWVGLTDEEKLAANQMWRVMDADGFIKAIEAKLKEKNT